MVKVLPNNPAHGQPARVEIHEGDDSIRQQPQAEELTQFPGPLVRYGFIVLENTRYRGQLYIARILEITLQNLFFRHDTHKNDVLLFCQKKAKECTENIHMLDRDSAVLLWKYLELLIKQNGVCHKHVKLS